MKKILPCVLLLFLCACAKSETSAYNEYRGRDVFFEARIVQIGEEFENTYRVQFEGNGDAGKITVLEPESISGITAEIKDGTAHFDGTVILTDSPSPLCAICDILKAWQNEPIECGSEGENTYLVFENVRSVFSQTAPIYSEIISDGRVLLRVEYLKSEVKQ